MTLGEVLTRPSRRPWWRTGWVPAGLLIGGLAITLNYYDVGWLDLVVYAGYLTALVILPGTLIWRAVTGRAYAFGEEVAAGTGVGLALEVLAYIPARAAGVPLLFLAAPVLTVVAFLAVPRLRQHWRPGPRTALMPTWYSWTLAVLCGLVVVYLTATHFRGSGPTPPGYGISDSDTLWYVAVIDELKNHVPPMLPYAPVGPVLYHWFSFAEMAATDHVTGIEPLTLMRRLAILPYLAVLALITAAIGRRVVGRWWAGAAALAAAFFVVAPHPFHWTPVSMLWNYGFGLVEDGSLLRYTLYYGPPQSFGAALFAVVVLLLLGLLRGEQRGWPAWLLMAGLVATVAGAKVTYLALLLAGAGSVLLVDLLRRRVNRPALGVLGLTAGGLVLANFLIGGTASGLKIAPLSQLGISGFRLTGVLDEPTPVLALLALLGVTLFGWASVWGAALAIRPRDVVERPEVALLGGIGLVGLVGVLAFSHPGLSQVAFIQGARPYLCILAVLGLARLLGTDPAPATWRKLGIAAGAGVVVMLAIRLLSSSVFPSTQGDPGQRWRVLLTLLWPYALVAVLVLGTGLVLRRIPRTRALAGVLALATLLGMGLESTLHDRLGRPVLTAFSDGWSVPTGEVFVTPGLPEAARWIRDHSASSDIVATNAHCLFTTGPCNNARFTGAAFTERRVLIEGWGYTVRGEQLAEETGVDHFFVPYWADPAVLADNDAAFSDPSTQTIARLRDTYGVRWLLVDLSQNPPSPQLGQFATLRYANEGAQVYELPPAP